MGQMIVENNQSRSTGGRRHGDGPQYAFFLGRCRTAAGAEAAGFVLGQPAGRGGGRGAGGAGAGAAGTSTRRGDVAGAGGGDGVRHESAASLLRELGRNPALLGLVRLRPAGPAGADRGGRRSGRRTAGRRWCICRVRAGTGLPTAWAFSRFVAGVAKLEDEVGAVSGMVAALRRRLMDELPRFGRHLGYDGKAVGQPLDGAAKRRRGSGRTRTRTGGSTRRTAWTRRRAGRGRR